MSRGDLYPFNNYSAEDGYKRQEIAKIRVVPHSLIRFEDGELCYITRRIDRANERGKLAMEDM